MAQVTVKVRSGHPTGQMLARLSDDSVVTVVRGGLMLDESQVSREMRECGWFEFAPADGRPASVPSESVAKVVPVVRSGGRTRRKTVRR